MKLKFNAVTFIRMLSNISLWLATFELIYADFFFLLKKLNKVDSLFTRLYCIASILSGTHVVSMHVVLRAIWNTSNIIPHAGLSLIWFEILKWNEFFTGKKNKFEKKNIAKYSTPSCTACKTSNGKLEWRRPI